MRVSDFFYDLPQERIAQEPLADRSASRLLHLDRYTGDRNDRQFRDFSTLLRPTDLLVFNNTRVFPARLYGRRAGLNAQALSIHNPASRDFLRGRVEVLLTHQLTEDPNEWDCLVRPGRKVGVGERLFFGEGGFGESGLGEGAELQAEVIGRGAFGERRIRFLPVDDFLSRLEKVGHVPLPPYIGRIDSPSDRERYQTVYARHRGSVAAPTAGLHFTAKILEQIKARDIQSAEITLHVGLGTFQPIRAERVEEHRLHAENYAISVDAAEKINAALSQSRRIIAVGTTTVRTLEFAAQLGNGKIAAGAGQANLFIYPGYEFQVVRGMLTNFHLPESTLLMLVSAFAGTGNVLGAYRHAVAHGYRFYSYGDCMFID